MLKKFLLGITALLLSTNMAYASGNLVVQSAQLYTPILTGQTDNMGGSYTTQVGYFYTLGNYTYVAVNIVTTGTVTKTTTTDNFGFSLPLPSVTQTNHLDMLVCDAENATPIQLGTTGTIGSGASSALIQGPVGTSPAYNQTQMTWATTSPGIGVLTHVLTVKCAGWYQTGTN